MAELASALDAVLTPAARDWLAEALTDPAWQARFASAGRHCGRAALAGPDQGGTPRRDAAQTAGLPEGITADAAARVLLLHRAGADPATVTRLYQQGDAAERRAVLYALDHLPLGAAAAAIVQDALRTHDTRLIAAAVGPYAARHLDQHTWRHAVLKCLFTGVPVRVVSGLADRADTVLARMVRDYAHERTAAGRPVPDDVRQVLALVPASDTGTQHESRPSNASRPSEA